VSNCVCLRHRHAASLAANPLSLEPWNLLIHILILILSFVIILAGAEMFTNGVEWAGARLKISEAAVGSLLAAVGTALPETLIPAVALLSGPGDHPAHSAVGVGAIMGAPLMLSTLALFVMGGAAIGFRKRRGRVAMIVAPHDVRRDLAFFLPVFLVLVVLGTLNLGLVARRAAAGGLIFVYGAYGVTMLRQKRAEGIALEHGLYFERIFRGNPLAPRFRMTLAQVIGGVVAILIGANAFVDEIVLFSHRVESESWRAIIDFESARHRTAGKVQLGGVDSAAEGPSRARQYHRSDGLSGVYPGGAGARIFAVAADAAGIAGGRDRTDLERDLLLQRARR
jgi:Ca2+/Na+ antiporter